jgi:hypothetical protein
MTVSPWLSLPPLDYCAQNSGFVDDKTNPNICLVFWKRADYESTPHTVTKQST